MSGADALIIACAKGQRIVILRKRIDHFKYLLRDNSSNLQETEIVCVINELEDQLKEEIDGLCAQTGLPKRKLMDESIYLEK
jgi:hypothetical protein